MQLMVTYCVETPEIGVTILSDGVRKPFLVLPAANDDLLCPDLITTAPVRRQMRLLWCLYCYLRTYLQLAQTF